MIGFKIDQAKGLFFDSAKIVRSVDAATRRVLSKFGAFVRTSARSSIRKRKRSAAEGQPPSSHTGLLKKFIFFGYDPERRSVVIGPARLGKPGEAPRALELGGPSMMPVRHGVKVTLVPVEIKPHPYMGPALKRELPKLPAMWANSVKR
jgi:hypothetical protein